MKMKQLMIAGCSILVLSTGAALAVPVTRAAPPPEGRRLGPAKTGDSQTTGMASNTGQHPPTGTMNQKTGDTAASSQDAQRQMQGEPTAAQRPKAQRLAARPQTRIAEA